MRRGTIIAIAIAAALMCPTAARAQYYLNRHQAESTTRNFLHWTLGYHYTLASCRPQGRPAPEPGYIYHRWVCGWVAGDTRRYKDCRGRSRVSGSSNESKFYWFVLFHEGDCPNGWNT